MRSHDPGQSTKEVFGVIIGAPVQAEDGQSPRANLANPVVLDVQHETLYTGQGSVVHLRARTTALNDKHGKVERHAMAIRAS